MAEGGLDRIGSDAMPCVNCLGPTVTWYVPYLFNGGLH
jgi:hypothetical protein